MIESSFGANAIGNIKNNDDNSTEFWFEYIVFIYFLLFNVRRRKMIQFEIVKSVACVTLYKYVWLDVRRRKMMQKKNE